MFFCLVYTFWIIAMVMVMQLSTVAKLLRFKFCRILIVKTFYSKMLNLAGTWAFNQLLGMVKKLGPLESPFKNHVAG